MSFRLNGTVYGTLLNFRGEYEALGEAMHQPPYKAPPQAPVLYVKPANTWTAAGEPIVLPPDVPEAEIGATVGMVMKAPGEVAGYVLICDVSVPHANFFRPPVKAKCRDGFLGVGPTLLPAAPATDPAGFVLEVRINGELRQTVRFADLVRPAQQLLADVSEFMTLAASDVLLLGCDAGRPKARAGDRIDISAPSLGTLGHLLVQEAP